MIKEIELNNFRIYKGKNTINLLPTDDKNIVVVSGKNGYGKTTFLVSLVWCLYGRQMEKVDALYKKEIEDKGNYTKYISGCMNRQAKDEGQTTFSVSVTFQGVRIPDLEFNEIKITRSYDINTGRGDKIEILLDGYKNEVTGELGNDNQSGEEIFIREFILPIDIAKFFLFDAEKIVALADMNSPQQRKDLSVAYSEVLGIKKYEDLRNNLNLVLDKYRRKSASPSEKKRLASVQAEIETAKIEIEDIHFKIEQLQEEKSEKKNEADAKQTKLIQEGKIMTEQQLEELRRDERLLQEKKEDLKTKLREFYDFIPFGLAGETLIELHEQLQKEELAKQTQYDQNDLIIKIQNIVDDIEKERVASQLFFPTNSRDFYEKQIKKQIKKYFASEMEEIEEGFIALHDLPTVQLNEVSNLINKLNSSVKNDLERINNEFSYTENQINSINRKIRDAEKDAENPYIKNLREEKNNLDKRINEIDNEVLILSEKKWLIESERTKLLKEQNRLREKIDEAAKLSELESEANITLKFIKDNISNYQKAKKESLEKNMLSGLNTLLHKKDFIKDVVVDISSSGQDIDIVLYDERKTKIDKSSLSMGERQMYASALLNALVDESDIEFPVFIDSPMQKFDRDHAENVIRHFYPNVSKQVVIFPLLEKELTVEEYEILKANVSKAYLIQNINNDSSKFVETTPEELINTYHKI
ncbi:DNA sulfur modification protein DndD [Bernardetia litoralis DSM 6794]|uniref:DNA sulfur modification protein DndD n=1 Tax=Bernardetia litoralis (strain ATCC 23117 / DSM 6794 / NBRC 15988 / NCIMB 1366 / Fx l1 / Sio-4) TaxID=880071 RepID=I4AJQ3_BERLS|nr:DNA sulfur modification protein DndD [Bernardetia litoralis DSM 6794]